MDGLESSLSSIILEDTDIVRNILSSRFANDMSSEDRKSIFSVWTRGVLKSGEFSDGSRISLSRNRWHGFGGGDFNINGFVLGSLAAYGHSFIKSKDLPVTVEIKDFHLGGCSGLNFDRLRVHAGYTVLWSDVKTSRDIKDIDWGQSMEYVRIRFLESLVIGYLFLSHL